MQKPFLYNAMKIGCPNNPRRDLHKEIEWIGRNGFDFIDLFLEEDKTSPEKIRVDAVKKLLDKYGLHAVGHTAWYLPIGSPVKALRDAAIIEMTRYFEIFGRLGVQFATIHAHWPGGMFSAKEGVAFQVESLKTLMKNAQAFGVSPMYEPIDTADDNLANVTTVLQSVPGLMFHLDIGHANLYGRTPAQFIEKFHHHLTHVHLHDNVRNMDLHLPPGCGTVNWDETLKALRAHYDGTITLEVFSRDRDYILFSREKLRKMWDAL